jgi:vesicle coat complex subunit
VLLLACPAPRRYPNRYESIIGVLCDSLESLDEPEAKASMVWIIGEYAERIDNAGGGPGTWWQL